MQTPRYSQTEIDNAKQSADIAAIISQKVVLKRQGDEYTGLCPFHNESTPSFTVVPKKKMYFCFGCGASGDAIKWLCEVNGLNFGEAVEQLRCAPPVMRTSSAAVPARVSEMAGAEADETRKRMERARKIWNEALPAQGTMVERYLESRGIGRIAIPPVLRFHPKVWHPETQTNHPAMIAAIIDCRGRQIMGIHRTYLTADGRSKLQGVKSKLMLGQCRGGFVHLSTVVGGRIAIAEGIETSLSVMKACPNLPVWAALSLSNMHAPVPRSVIEIILCADGDNKDQKKADEILTAAAHQHAMPGRTVRIARPETGKDFNDMMMKRSN